MPNTPLIVTGDKEIDANLVKFERKVQRKAITRSTREGAKIVLDDAKANVAYETGRLYASLKIRAIKRSRTKVGHSVTTREGMFAGDEFYGGFVELGTEDMEADPYLRPALWTNTEPVKQRFFINIRREIAALR